MKGVVFTEFLEFVEEQMSPEMADRVVERADPASGGAYTGVGTYDYTEMLDLVTALSEETGQPAADLVRTFGEHLFARFSESHPEFFAGIDGAFELLQNVEDYIHVEVRKLYPDAELPTLACEFPRDGQMHMTYRSGRPFADLAEGLIHGCISHFGEPVAVEREDWAAGDEAGTAARFTLTRQS
jgi:hypothetical protein